MKLETGDRKHHVLQHMDHHDHAGGEQLWPRAQVGSSLARHVHLPAKPQDPAHNPASDEFACPGHHRSVHGERKTIVIAASDRVSRQVGIQNFGVLRKGEVGVNVLVGSVVQDEDRAEEGEHAD